jgi:hypothetical protein
MGPSRFTPHPKEGVLRIFIALKNPSPWPGFEPATLGSSSKHTNHYITEVTYLSLSSTGTGSELIIIIIIIGAKTHKESWPPSEVSSTLLDSWLLSTSSSIPASLRLSHFISPPGPKFSCPFPFAGSYIKSFPILSEATSWFRNNNFTV